MKQIQPLPRGITGFTSYPNSLAIQELKPFISLIYSILRGTLEWEDLDLSGKNYYYFSIKSSDQEYHVFLNAYFPCVAISKKFKGKKFIFMRAEEILSQFKLLEDCNYLLLGEEILNQDLIELDFLDLDRAEIEQIRYWKPKTIIEIVFNNWD